MLVIGNPTTYGEKLSGEKLGEEWGAGGERGLAPTIPDVHNVAPSFAYLAIPSLHSLSLRTHPSRRRAPSLRSLSLPLIQVTASFPNLVAVGRLRANSFLKTTVTFSAPRLTCLGGGWTEGYVNTAQHMLGGIVYCTTVYCTCLCFV